MYEKNPLKEGCLLRRS